MKKLKTPTIDPPASRHYELLRAPGCQPSGRSSALCSRLPNSNSTSRGLISDFLAFLNRRIVLSALRSFSSTKVMLREEWKPAWRGDEGGVLWVSLPFSDTLPSSLPLPLQPWHPSSTTITPSTRSTQSVLVAPRTLARTTFTRSSKLEQRTKRTGCHPASQRVAKSGCKHARQADSPWVSQFFQLLSLAYILNLSQFPLCCC